MELDAFRCSFFRKCDCVCYKGCIEIVTARSSKFSTWGSRKMNSLIMRSILFPTGSFWNFLTTTNHLPDFLVR